MRARSALPDFSILDHTDRAKLLLNVEFNRDPEKLAALLAHELTRSPDEQISANNRGDALFCAGLGGQVENLAMLLAHDTKPEVVSRMEESKKDLLLERAIGLNYIDVIKTILADELTLPGNKQLSRKTKGKLFERLDGGRLEIMRLMLAHEMDPRVIKKMPRTARGKRLNWAAEAGCHAMIQLLFDHDLRPDVRQEMLAKQRGSAFMKVAAAQDIPGMRLFFAHETKVFFKMPASISVDALRHATEEGHMEVLEVILGHHDTNSRVAEKLSAAGKGLVLQDASQKEATQLLTAMLAHDANPLVANKITEEDRWNALHAAIEKERKVSVGILLAYELNPQVTDKLTSAHRGQALFFASKKGFAEILEILLAHDANPLVANKITEMDRWMALYVAIDKGRKESVGILLAHELNPQVTDKLTLAHRGQALRIASEIGFVEIPEIPEILLAHDANPLVANKITEEDRWNALHAAINKGRIMIVGKLLAHELNPQVTDKLTSAHCGQELRIASEKGFMNLPKVLLAHDANPLVANKITEEDRWNALHAAIDKGAEESVGLLLAHELNPQVTDKLTSAHLGRALRFASEKKRGKESIKMLLAHDANPLVTNKISLADKVSALATSAANSHGGSVRALLANGLTTGMMDIMSAVQRGSVLSFAVRNNEAEVAQAILTHNANPQVTHKLRTTDLGSALNHTARNRMTESITKRTELLYEAVKSDSRLSGKFSEHLHRLYPDAIDIDNILKNEENFQSFIRKEHGAAADTLNAFIDSFPAEFTKANPLVFKKCVMTEIALALLAHDANPLVTNKITLADRATALRTSTEFGHVGCVHALLAHDANPLVTNKITLADRAMALRTSTKFGHVEVVGTLLTHELKPEVTPKMNALHIARALNKMQWENTYNLFVFAKHDLTPFLTQAPSRANRALSLFIACCQGNRDGVTSILANELKPEITPKIPAKIRGLSWAIAARHHEIIQAFADHELNPLVTGKISSDGLGAVLSHVALNGYSPSVELMLAHNANPLVIHKITDPYKITALMVAAKAARATNAILLLPHVPQAAIDRAIPHAKSKPLQIILWALSNVVPEESLETSLAAEITSVRALLPKRLEANGAENFVKAAREELSRLQYHEEHYKLRHLSRSLNKRIETLQQQRLEPFKQLLINGGFSAQMDEIKSRQVKSSVPKRERDGEEESWEDRAKRRRVIKEKSPTSPVPTSPMQIDR